MTRTSPNIPAVIKRTPVFRALAPAALSQIAAAATPLDLPRAGRLFRRGDRCAGFYVVANGRILLSIPGPDNTQKALEIVGPGNPVGLAAALLGIAQPAQADAIVDSSLVMIPREAMLEIAARNGECALQLVNALSREVCALTADVESISLRSGRERIASYLWQLATAGGSRSHKITLPAKKSVIASRLNLTPEYFSRMLHDLAACGAISVEARQITVLDPDRLRAPAR